MRVLVVDDDALVARSVAALLRAEPGIEVAAMVGSGHDAVNACVRDAPDLVLMDLRMPGMDGVEATRRVKAVAPATRVLVLTSFPDDASVRAALEAGADGYVLKTDPPETLAARVRAAATGAVVLDPGLLRRLAEPESAALEELTLREREVTELVAQGLSNREIAERLFVAEGTVRNVLSSVLEKLGLRDRTQLAIHYWRRDTAPGSASR